MPSPVSVVIPALNEAASIRAAVESAFAAGAAEVIVSDGGSSDETVSVARACGAVVIEGERMRARQSNAGAALATAEVVLFLHADSRLPSGACAATAGAIDCGAEFGGFRIRFIERSFRLRVAAFMINLRTAITRCPWGDQAQFVRRQGFPGFREIPLMEDYDLAVRTKNRVVLPLTVETSGRRFLHRGVLRTALLNWRIVVAFRRGADPEELARMYRS